MDILATIDLPDMPPIDWGRDVCIAITIALALLGVLLMWKGLRLSRWLLMLAGAGIGYGIADACNINFGTLDWRLTAAICTVGGAIVGFLMARVLLAFWAGAIVASGVLYWIITEDVAKVSAVLPPSPNLPANATPEQWATEMSRISQEYMQATWDEKAWVAVAILAAAAIIPILFALLLKKHAVIFITSLFGAIAAVAAFAIAARAVDVTNDPREIFIGVYCLIAIGALTLIGTTVQHVFSGKKKSSDSDGGSE